MVKYNNMIKEIRQYYYGTPSKNESILVKFSAVSGILMIVAVLHSGPRVSLATSIFLVGFLSSIMLHGLLWGHSILRNRSRMS